MHAELICPKCGASSKEVHFIGVFCTQCKAKELSEKIKIPRVLQVLRCKECGKFKFKKWIESLEQLGNQFLSQFRGPFEKSEVMALNEEVCKIDFIFPELRLSREIPIKISSTICNVCAKAARGYYEALIQIRDGKEEVSRLATQIIKRLEQRTFIPATKEFPFGVDIYAGSLAATRAVLSELGLRTKITRKLYGIKAGKKLFRTTFLVRI